MLIRVKAAGVNPKDTYERAGNYGPKDFPFIPGGDAAGIVEIVGEGVSNVKVRTRRREENGVLVYEDEWEIRVDEKPGGAGRRGVT